MYEIETVEKIVQPQPITEIPQQAYAGLQAFWGKIRDECEERFTPAQCQALLGARPTILEPETHLPWYVVFGIGVLVGKVVL